MNDVIESGIILLIVSVVVLAGLHVLGWLFTPAKCRHKWTKWERPTWFPKNVANNGTRVVLNVRIQQRRCWRCLMVQEREVAL